MRYEVRKFDGEVHTAWYVQDTNTGALMAWLPTEGEAKEVARILNEENTDSKT